jgi:putative tricarboxylic transport membrane protein
VTRLNKDVIAGALFIVCGAAGLWIGKDYAIGTAFRMGPGYFPRVLCGLLVLLGVFIAGKGLVRGGESPEGLHWRPLFLITLAVIAFATLISTAGLLPAAAAVVFIGALGGPEFRIGEGLLLAALLTIAAVALFKFGLKMTMPIIDIPFLGLKMV